MKIIEASPTEKYEVATATGVVQTTKKQYRPSAGEWRVVQTLSIPLAQLPEVIEALEALLPDG